MLKQMGGIITNGGRHMGWSVPFERYRNTPTPTHRPPSLSVNHNEDSVVILKYILVSTFRRSVTGRQLRRQCLCKRHFGDHTFGKLGFKVKREFARSHSLRICPIECIPQTMSRRKRWTESTPSVHSVRYFQREREK